MQSFVAAAVSVGCSAVVAAVAVESVAAAAEVEVEIRGHWEPAAWQVVHQCLKPRRLKMSM